MNLDNLPADIFIKRVTYLPFDTVVTLCKTEKYNDYCTSERYSNEWRQIIEDTYKNNVYDYQGKLNKIQKKYPGYNYLVYTEFVKLLDPAVQGMIYYLQNDKTRFDSLSNEQKFFALFLLNKPNEMEKYNKNSRATNNLIKLAKGGKISQQDLDDILYDYYYIGVNFIKALMNKGADIHGHRDLIFKMSQNPDITNFGIEHGADTVFKEGDPNRFY